VVKLSFAEPPTIFSSCPGILLLRSLYFTRCRVGALKTKKAPLFTQRLPRSFASPDDIEFSSLCGQSHDKVKLGQISQMAVTARMASDVATAMPTGEGMEALMSMAERIELFQSLFQSIEYATLPKSANP
jgi:hypothetical protein